MLQDYRMILDATVEMRREMNRRMIAAQTPAEHERAHQLHEDAARVARKYGI